MACHSRNRNTGCLEVKILISKLYLSYESLFPLRFYLPSHISLARFRLGFIDVAEVKIVILLYQCIHTTVQKCIKAIERHHIKRHEKIRKRRREIEKIEIHIHATLLYYFFFFRVLFQTAKCNEDIQQFEICYNNKKFLCCKLPGRPS